MNKHLFQGYIFDLDGVIVDTARYHYAAWRRLAQKLGFDITPEQNENLKGVSRTESLEYILTLCEVEIHDDEKTKLTELKNMWYVDSISDMDESELLPGAKEFLIELNKAGKRIALGSASKNAERILRSTGIIHLFEAIIDGTKTTESKPHPQVFLMGAEALDLDPEVCVVFEDSIKGVQAAKRGGFAAVGIGDGDTLAEADITMPGLEGITIARLDQLLAQNK